MSALHFIQRSRQKDSASLHVDNFLKILISSELRNLLAIFPLISLRAISLLVTAQFYFEIIRSIDFKNGPALVDVLGNHYQHKTAMTKMVKGQRYRGSKSPQLC